MAGTTLFLLCSNYPQSAGEFFIDDEMRVLTTKFDRIVVFANSSKQNHVARFVPKNLIVVECNFAKITLRNIVANLPFVVGKMFLNELKAARRLKVKFSLLIFKIMFADYIKAKSVMRQLLNYRQQHGIPLDDIIFYSYWHDYKALGLAMLRHRHPAVKAIARSHGWDNFKDRQKTQYLPFKTYMLQHLTQTFSISAAGKTEFLRYGDFQNKVTVSRLGKINTRTPLLHNDTNSFRIVSCSNLIPIKRVNLIIDVIAQLSEVGNIVWTHFGDGPLREELEEYASRKLTNCEFEFKGIVENKKILDFYASNYVDIFINVSEHEGIPVSIMEAVSAGIPVLATDVGGTNEIVNADNGFLVAEDFDVAEAARIIMDYSALPLATQLCYRQNAYRFWKQHYEATKNYSEFYAMLKKL